MFRVQSFNLIHISNLLFLELSDLSFVGSDSVFVQGSLVSKCLGSDLLQLFGIWFLSCNLSAFFFLVFLDLRLQFTLFWLQSGSSSIHLLIIGRSVFLDGSNITFVGCNISLVGTLLFLKVNNIGVVCFKITGGGCIFLLHFFLDIWNVGIYSWHFGV